MKLQKFNSLHPFSASDMLSRICALCILFKKIIAFTAVSSQIGSMETAHMHKKEPDTFVTAVVLLLFPSPDFNLVVVIQQ